MRRVALALLALGFSASVASGAPASARCGGRLPRAAAGLPAPLSITTECGRFRIGRDGRIARTPKRLPVPRGAAAWSPTDGSWYRLDRGRLVIGRWHQRLWRSRGRFEPGYDVGALTIGPDALAFSFGNSARLFVAGLDSAEHEVADGEYPLGWTRGGDLFTHTSWGGRLRLRHADGDLARTLPGAVDYTFDRTNGEVVFVQNGRVLRTDGSAPVELAGLTRLGLTRRPEIDPLGRLLALRDQRRVVVLRRDGSVLASSALPRRQRRVDGISSPLVASPDGRSVAFTLTRGNTAYGSRGTETVYLLRSGMRHTVRVHTERLRFAICERGADLAWHGRWLLYSAAEGKVVVLDGAGRRRGLDLTRAVLRLPGSHGGEGHANVTASWSGSS